MKLIPLTQSRFAKVSDHRFDELKQWNWQFGDGYAYRIQNINGSLHTIRMHVQIMNPPKGMEVDHKDLDKLNNQDDNLRVCTSSQNKANKGLTTRNTSGYKGVSWNKKDKKWKVAIDYDNHHIYLGRFDDVIEAAKAYDKAARIYHGEYANLNFP